MAPATVVPTRPNGARQVDAPGEAVAVGGCGAPCAPDGPVPGGGAALTGPAWYPAMAAVICLGQNDAAELPPGATASWQARSNCGSVGRAAGSLARQAVTTARSLSGTESSAGAMCTTRNSTAGASPWPKGATPAAAKASVEPSANTSLAGPAGLPMACSGAM